MKNELDIQIPQNEAKSILGLNDQDFYHLKKIFNITNSIDKISYKLFSGMIDYQKKTGNESSIDIKAATYKNLSKFGSITTEIKSERVKKTSQKKKTSVPKKPTFENKNFIKYPNRTEACKAFNSQLKIYYSLKPAVFIEDCESLDITKSFNANLKEIKQKHPDNRYLFFYSDNTKFEKSLRTIKTAKTRVWTKEEDEKILKYYNSDAYKNPYAKNMKNAYTMKDLEKDVKADRKQISIRASAIGFTNFKRPKETDYKNEEIEILKKYNGIKSPNQIRLILKEHGYTRSTTSINIKLTRMKLSSKLNGKGDLSLTLLAKAMGADVHHFDRNKKFMEFMQPIKEEKQYLFSRKKLKAYIMENPYEFNFGKVDNKFFVELLTEVF